MKTSVVGSFPLSHSVENLRVALEDQLRAGIDYPSSPQLQDMNLMFLKPLAEQGCGIEIIENEAWLKSDLIPPKSPVAIEDLEWTLRFLQHENAHRKFVGVKMPITGPITLSSTTKILKDTYAVNYPDLILRFADVVSEIVKQSCEHGVKMISIDEPCIPFALWLGISEDVIIEAVNKSIGKAENCITALHVCGELKGISRILLKTDAKILNHEFKAIPKNLDEYKKTDLEKHDKLIGLGCVQTKPYSEGKIPIESPQEIEQFILKAGEKLGLEHLMIFPDCGFGGLKELYPTEKEAQDIAYKKMANMVQAARKIRKEKLMR
ncbi:MAG TPA: hypothetical protein VED00_01300 [archaeon]|nr:hypothetical protein [archaeon]